MCAWIYPRSNTTDQDIFFYGSQANIQMFLVKISSRIDIGDWNSESVSSAASISRDRWYHICAGRQNATSNNWPNQTIYINGVLDSATKDDRYTIGGGETNIFAIGSDSYGSNFFNGTIDEVMFFNRTLNSSEVSVIYNMNMSV